MIIVKIIGGLGNQMFQYAYAKSLQERGNNVKIDLSAFETYILHGGYQLDKYNIDLECTINEENNIYYQNSLLNKVLKKLKFYKDKTIQEQSLLYDKSLLNVKDDNYINGYFQSEKYFKNIRDSLIEQFTIKQGVSDYTNKIKAAILDSKNSCSIHIRRGDFINSINLNVHGACDLKYYIKAVNIVESKFKSIKYFIFSDDITWCKENLKLDNVVYVDSEEKRLPHEDIYLMSLCNHNIIANSSFSWWGAWLNKCKEKIVIAPDKWFEDEELLSQSYDIVPNSWIKL